MIVLIKLFYAVAISCLLILVIAFGVRAVYEGPEEPRYPISPAIPRPIPDENGVVQPPQGIDEAQRAYQEAYDQYLKERATYRRNVLVIVSALGIAAIGGGLALPGRLDAIRLGLVLGGLGTMLYGVLQAGEDLDKAGPVVIVAVAGLGLAAILLIGYRWLGRLDEARPDA